MKTISKIYLSKMRMSKSGYIGMDYYGYVQGTYIYQAIWNICINGKEYDYCEYFRAKSREAAKEAVIKHMSPYGYKPGDIKFYN